MDNGISPENERFIRSAIENGEFQDRTAMLNEALRLLQERRRRTDQLKKDIEAWINSGEPVAGRDVFRHIDAKARRIAEQTNLPSE